MAGYLFSLKNTDSLRMYAENGVYSTIISNPSRGIWRTHQEATVADYSTMNSGDNVYFFVDRKIYGIGKLVNISGLDCKFNNYPDSSIPDIYKNYNDEDFLWHESSDSIKQRWICTFKPDPLFFTNGVDMDEVLTSNPSAFRILRVFWKVSFIKFDDEENQAFRDIILQLNQDSIKNSKTNVNTYEDNSDAVHTKIAKKLTNKKYLLDIAPFLNTINKGTYIKHEMAIELAILFQLNNNDTNTVSTFGCQDFLSHQVVASPFKPVDYMDKMDIFGYRYIKDHSPTKSIYTIIEIKKDEANCEDIDQIMKYVDWVNEEYAHQNYMMINAFLVCYDFDTNLSSYAIENAVRNFTLGRRPARNLQWNNLNLVKYTYDQNENKINFLPHS